MQARIKNPALGVPVALEVAQELGVSASNAGVSESRLCLRRFAVVWGREG
jgi:hypothetical protein